MECPYCQATAVTLVKDRLVVEPSDSLIKKTLHPGERPSAMGPIYFITGIVLLVLSVMLKRTRIFTNMFWDGHWRSVLDTPGINPVGWIILLVLWVGCVACALYGLSLIVNKSARLAIWEKKSRFYESGLICVECMKVWLPGLETHPISAQDSHIE